MENYIEVTRQRLIEVGKQFGLNVSPCFAECDKVRVDKRRNSYPPYYKVKLLGKNGWTWVFSIPESWYIKLKEE